MRTGFAVRYRLGDDLLADGQVLELALEDGSWLTVRFLENTMYCSHGLEFDAATLDDPIELHFYGDPALRLPRRRAA